MQRARWLDILILISLLLFSQVRDLLRSVDIQLSADTGITLGRIIEVILGDGTSLTVLALALVALMLAHGVQIALGGLACSQLPGKLAHSRLCWWSIQLSLVLLVAVANHFCFPYSRSFPDIDLVLAESGPRALLWLVAAVLAALILAGMARTAWRMRSALRHPAIIGGLIVVVGTAVWWEWSGRVSIPVNKKPHIIVIGVDSLRPEMLSHPATVVPNISQLSAQGVTLPALTPIARTFAAWMSLLTGRYPVSSGIRDNLFPRASVPFGDLLPDRLRAVGYQTAFIMDEVRFADIDQQFGFDLVGSPPAGVADIGIANFLDFAPLNLMSLIPASRHLLPASFANRGARYVYWPAAFNSRLRALLAQLDQRPAFIAAHFCLPHYPYWPDPARTPIPQPDPDVEPYPQGYLQALHLVDLQVGLFLSDLRQRGLLENAVIVLMSDHGESLDRVADVLDGDPEFAGRRLSGHGSSVLAQEQNRVLLSLIGLGQATAQRGRLHTEVSLVDLYPTVLAIAGAPAPDAVDGIDLSASLLELAEPPPRVLPVETGMISPALVARQIKEADVVRELAQNYELLDSGKLQIRQSSIPPLLRFKQRAVFHQQQALAWMPLATAGPRWAWLDRARGEVGSGTVVPAEFGGLRASFCQIYREDVAHLQDACVETGADRNDP